MRTFARKPTTAQLTTSAWSTMLGRVSFGQSRALNPILDLQRATGNRTVESPFEEQMRDVKGDSTPTTPARFGHDFSRIAVHTPVAGAVQTRLAINKPGDRYEQEADNVADQVMSMPEPQLQRVCACDGACPKCRDQQDGQEHIQTKPAQGTAVGGTTAPPAVAKVLSSPGQPLDSATRAFFEPRFGQDFSHVRVHTDTPAAESANAVNAQAYTVGNHIVFGPREDTPTTQARLQLLAHELTHVVQQGAHRRVIQRRPPTDSTNYRFDTYRVSEADLSDPDIVARFKSLPLGHLIQYRNRVSDPAVIDGIDQLLNDRLSAQTFDQLFADLATEKDPIVRNYIDQWLATHAPTSYEIALGANKPGETETAINASGISVTVLPDEFVDAAAFKSLTDRVAHGHASATTKAITVYDPKWHPRWVVTAGKVTTIRPTIQELKLKTVYLRGTSRINPSGYGVGTREEDVKTGRTTLAHHEGSHATCFLQYLRDNAPPTFAGKKGDTDTQINEKAQAFKTAMEQYYAKMAALCGPAVDCTGKKASFCP
jgi:hypothetical protein